MQVIWSEGVKPTDTQDPDYFHRVVDCQWACPAHTDVPLYIRMIAQGRFSDAYMVNRQSNVFPGILGRVCDRPCEPACRRGRVDEEPVAICRLKRVAADYKEDISDRLPRAPARKNGKRIALVGAGCASMTVANDLLPLGYEMVMFEKNDTVGGLIRTNIPSFRLPGSVIDEEFGNIDDMGLDLRLGEEITSMKRLLEEGYDAVFIGTGAPRGKELDLPGRHDSDQVFIGIDWLESVAFKHIDRIGKRVLIIGAGNTAMDCCRTSLRLGASDVKVVARKPRNLFKASEWELEDAIEENVDIVTGHAPREFITEKGVLKGMRFDQVEWFEKDGRLQSRKLGEAVLEADAIILAIGQENAFPWIERDIGIEFNRWDMPEVDRSTFRTTRPEVFAGGDAAWGPENIIWAVAHGHQAAISIHRYCQGLDIRERPPRGVTLCSTKMGIHEWSFNNDFDESARRAMQHVALSERFRKLDLEVELGFSAEQVAVEVQRCLNCDIQTTFAVDKCIECDACVDVCPTRCLTITQDQEEEDLRCHLSAPAENREQPLFVSPPLPQTRRVMVKDEDQCVHCSLCAERCPTAAWDMQKSSIFIPQACDDASASAQHARQRRKAG